MPLDHIEQILINQTQEYLGTSLNYDILRSNCLAVTPVQSILIPVLTLMDSIDTEEMTQARVLLTQQVLHRQIEQDMAQERSDKISSSICKTAKEQLETNIISLRSKKVTAEAIYIAHQYTNTRANSASKQEDFIFNNHLTNITQIDREISIHETRIENILIQENNLKKQKIERNKRHFSRTTYPNEFAENTLLSSTINQMKELAEERCYPVLLSQLELQVDTLSCLSPYEKIALKQIIIIMKDCQPDIGSRLQHDAELFRLEAELESNWQIYASKTAHYKQLNHRNTDLIHSNKLLNSTLTELNNNYEKLLKLRNDYSIATLAAVGIKGAVSVTAYFLIQAGIMSPVFGLIGASVLGVAIIGLIITSSAFAFMAAFKNDEIRIGDNHLLNNKVELSQNEYTMTEYQKIELHNLSEKIYQCQIQVADQIRITDAARQKEMLSLENAKNIRVNGPGAGHYNNSFFLATPMPSINDSMLNDSMPEVDSMSDYSYLFL